MRSARKYLKFFPLQGESQRPLCQWNSHLALLLTPSKDRFPGDPSGGWEETLTGRGSRDLVSVARSGQRGCWEDGEGVESKKDQEGVAIGFVAEPLSLKYQAPFSGHQKYRDSQEIFPGW